MLVIDKFYELMETINTDDEKIEISLYKIFIAGIKVGGNAAIKFVEGEISEANKEHLKTFIDEFIKDAESGHTQIGGIA